MYFSLFIFLFYLSHGFVLLCICFAIALHSDSPPWFFTHRMYRSYGPLPSLQQCMVPSHNHTQIPCFTPLTPPFHFPCSTYIPVTFPTHTITVFTTQFSPFASQAHTPPQLFPLSSSSIPYINRTGIPTPVINNELLDHFTYIYTHRQQRLLANIRRMYGTLYVPNIHWNAIAMFHVMSPFVINVPTRDLLVPRTKLSFEIMVGT